MNGFINKKQLGVMLILIALMAVLFVAQRGFNDRLRIVALMNSNITDFKEYSIDEGKYVYKLPYEWITEQKTYPGKYIVYNSNFKNDSLGLIGYIQLINSNDNLDKIISSDKEKLNNAKIMDYKVVPSKANGNECRKISYKEKLSEGKLVYHNTYYISESKDSFLKADFSIGQDRYKENLTSVFDTIVESFKEVK